MQTNKSQAQNESVHSDWEIINLFSKAPAQGSFEEHRAQHKPARTRQLLRAILPLPLLPMHSPPLSPRSLPGEQHREPDPSMKANHLLPDRKE